MFGAIGAIFAIAFGILSGHPVYRTGLALLGRTRRLAEALETLPGQRGN